MVVNLGCYYGPYLLQYIGQFVHPVGGEGMVQRAGGRALSLI